MQKSHISKLCKTLKSHKGTYSINGVPHQHILLQKVIKFFFPDAGEIHKWIEHVLPMYERLFGTKQLDGRETNMGTSVVVYAQKGVPKKLATQGFAASQRRRDAQQKAAKLGTLDRTCIFGAAPLPTQAKAFEDTTAQRIITNVESSDTFKIFAQAASDYGDKLRADRLHADPSLLKRFEDEEKREAKIREARASVRITNFILEYAQSKRLGGPIQLIYGEGLPPDHPDRALLEKLGNEVTSHYV